LAAPLTSVNKTSDKFDSTEFIRHEKPENPDQKIHIMTQQAKARKMSFKTVSYLLGNFSQMASYLYKPVQKPQENEQTTLNISKQFSALKGSSTIVSNTDLLVTKTRRFSDPFNIKDNQHDIESSIDSQDDNFSPVVEQEGSSTSDDSQDSTIEAILMKSQTETEG
jgi:hypothetical protein